MAVIQEKARNLYEELLEVETDVVPFAASDNWFGCFEKHHAFRNLKVTGKAASADNRFSVLMRPAFRSKCQTEPTFTFQSSKRSLHFFLVEMHQGITKSSL
jgi:hypothetical protein